MLQSRISAILSSFKRAPAEPDIGRSHDDVPTHVPVRIQVLTDLHLEVNVKRVPFGDELPPYEYDFPVCAENLALLGDIGLTKEDRLFDWLRLQLRRFKIVYFLSGNHEAYRSTLKESSARLAAFTQECDKQRAAEGQKLKKNAEEESTGGADTQPGQPPLGHFILLDRTRHDLSPTVSVLGCTLWSHLAPAHVAAIHRSLNDFRMIDGLDPSVYQSLHARDVAWLAERITRIRKREPWRRIVVMTHHAPTVADTSDPGHDGSVMNSAFATELTGEKWWKAGVGGGPEGPGSEGEPEGGLKVWLFGHTHWPCDFERAGVRIASNPRGYHSNGEDGYEPDFVVEV